MKCSNHKMVDASAICRWCLRPLCDDCSVTVEDAKSCKGQCEQLVAETVRYTKSVYSRDAQGDQRFWIVFLFFTGILCLVGEVRQQEGYASTAGALLIFYGCWIAYGSFVRQRKRLGK